MEKMKLETTERAGSRTLMEPRRIVVKIGTSTIVHSRTGKTDFGKMEKLARDLSDLSNRGIQVVIVSSGAIGMPLEAGFQGVSRKVCLAGKMRWRGWTNAPRKQPGQYPQNCLISKTWVK